MGVCLRANNRKCDIEFDMGYIGFYSLRKFIGEKLSPSNYIKWLETNDKTPKEIVHSLNEQILNDVGQATYNFLLQKDYQGSISYKECKELLEKIKNLTNTHYYGYVYCQHSFNDFKTLLQFCYSHRTKLIWY